MAETTGVLGNNAPQISEDLVDSNAAMKFEALPKQNHNQTNNKKRPHPDDDGDDKHDGDADAGINHKRRKQEKNDAPEAESPAPVAIPESVPKLSKNQQKKLNKKIWWDDKKDERRLTRHQKRKDKKARNRLERDAEIAAAAAEGREPILPQPPPKVTPVQVPVTVIFDCQFEKYMVEKELVSLLNQVIRCYSDNKSSHYPMHMFVSSYGGHMKERNKTVLENQYKSWKNVHFLEGDFIEAATEAKELMAGPKGGQLIELLSQAKEGDSTSFSKPDNGNNTNTKKKQKAVIVPEPEPDDVDKSIVYLTADSPYTLDRLEPNTCYVIGGIIDKNREKGLCYRVAREKKVRTAKLPISEFMVMQTRHILTINQVMEIMLHWLETGDWAASFIKAIPTRKKGKLKEDESMADAGQEKPEEAAQEDEPMNYEVANPKSTEPEATTMQEPQGPIQVEGEEGGEADKDHQKNSSDQQPW
ncbi:guanine-1-methyltransferase-domain-containing protein [Jackrogersella minutella]|nr:guanine-1-methyltransferase-domain-containing protein [Jackrogersella minutella]